MSVPSISSSLDQTNHLYQTNSRKQQRQQEVTDLANALTSGDLSGAQQAFSMLQQFTSKPSANSQIQTGQQGAGSDTITADINALGQALQSGDLKTAQTDFTQLQKDIQSMGLGHHHHHHKASTGAQDTSTAGSSGSGIGLDQLLAFLNTQNSSSGNPSNSATSLQQLLSIVKAIQGSSGNKIDAASLKALVGSNINIST